MALSEIIEFDRGLDYIMKNQKMISTMKVDSLTPHISDHINLDETIWLIIGDLDIIEKSLREKFSYPIVILDK